MSEMKKQVIYRVDVDYNYKSGRQLRKPIDYYIQDVLGICFLKLHWQVVYYRCMIQNRKWKSRIFVTVCRMTLVHNMERKNYYVSGKDLALTLIVNVKKTHFSIR